MQLLAKLSIYDLMVKNYHGMYDSFIKDWVKIYPTMFYFMNPNIHVKFDRFQAWILDALVYLQV